MSFPATAILSGLMIAQPVLALALPLHGNREFEDMIARDTPTTFSDNFPSGFPVHVVLSGNCDGNFKLYVYDNIGHLVARSEGPACLEQLTFTPKKTSRFDIVVKSESAMAEMEYELTIESHVGEEK